jgi:hypothetical protein
MNVAKTMVVVFLLIFAIAGSSAFALWFSMGLARDDYETRQNEVEYRLTSAYEIGEEADDSRSLVIIIQDLREELGSLQEEIQTEEQTQAQLDERLQHEETSRRTHLEEWASEQAKIQGAVGFTSDLARQIQGLQVPTEYRQVREVTPSDPINVDPTSATGRVLQGGPVNTNPFSTQEPDPRLLEPQSTGGLQAFWKEKSDAVDSARRAVVESRKAQRVKVEGLQRELEQLRVELQQVNNEYKVKFKDHVENVAQLKNRVERLDERIKHEVDKIRRELEIKEADGQVIRTGGVVRHEKTNFCMIDVGRLDGVRHGMKFDVFRETLSGQRLIKGRIEVSKVHGKMSECIILPPDKPEKICPITGWRTTDMQMKYSPLAISGEGLDEVTHLKRVDEYGPDLGGLEVRKRQIDEPIAAGDKISNPYFNIRRRPQDVSNVDWQMMKIDMILNGELRWDMQPGERLTFVLGGEPRYKSRREIRMLISENGGVLQEDLSLQTNFFITGTGKEAEEMMDQAREMGVRVIREEELYRMFGATMTR